MWINEQTQGTFRLHTDIRYECWKDGKELPGILDDAILVANGYALITEVFPTYDKITQGLTLQAPVKGEDGKWTLGYSVVELDPAIVTNNRNAVELGRIAMVNMQIFEGNQKAITAIIQNDTATLDAWKIKLAKLQAQL